MINSIQKTETLGKEEILLPSFNKQQPHFDTELKSWFIVEFEDSNKNGSEMYQTLWGIIKFDKKGRFDEDCYVSTSLIIENKNNEYIRTMNTVYKINETQGEKIILPFCIEAIQALRAGHSPLVIRQYFLNESIH